MLKNSFFLFLGLFLIFSCSAEINGFKDPKKIISGQVDFSSSGYEIKVSPAETGKGATVSLIYPEDYPDLQKRNKTLITGLTDENGFFRLYPYQNLENLLNQILILEASRRIGPAGSDRLALRTYLKWTEDGWRGITYPEHLLNSKTTALTLISAFNQQAFPPDKLIGSFTTLSGKILLQPLTGTVDQLLSPEKITEVGDLVISTLNQDRDPVSEIHCDGLNCFRKNNEKKPNFIFILTDDQSVYDLNHMPKILSLLKEQGITLNNFFVTWSLCCPSRVSLLRGQYAHNHLVRGIDPPEGGFPIFRDSGKESSTLATWLQDNNYYTGLIGKYLNSYPAGDSKYIPPGWNEWFVPTDSKEEVSLQNSYILNENGKLVTYNSGLEAEYRTDVYSRISLKFIENTTNQPFFLYINPSAPHIPANPAIRHKNLFSSELAPRFPSFNVIDPKNPLNGFNNSALTQTEIAKIDEEHRNRLRSLQAVDEMIEALIEKLKQQGKLNNTYIFFSSDNGYHLGDQRLRDPDPTGKNTYLDLDLRVPMLIRGPGIIPNTSSNELIINNDLAPTIAELAGISFPDFVDGRSFKNLVVTSPGNIFNGRKSFLFEKFFYDQLSYDTIFDFYGIRTQKYKYLEHKIEKKYLLYDLIQDPYELNNIYQEADPNLISQLKNLATALSTCKEQDCNNLENQEPLISPQ